MVVTLVAKLRMKIDDSFMKYLQLLTKGKFRRVMYEEEMVLN